MRNISKLSEFKECVAQNSKVAVHFWAGWCEPCALLDTVLEQLERDTPSVTCVRVEAEECPEISDHCSVAVVPLFLFFSRGKEVDRLEGAEPAELTSKFLGLANGGTPETTAAPPPPASNGHAPPPSVQTPPLKPRLDALVRQQPVMLFMKGSPDAPKCGFSRKVVEALRATDTPFGSFDILSDEAVRQGLKEYSNWPTYPQLYVNGELLGGCDIVLELAEAGELKGELAAAGAAAGGEEDAGNAPVDPKAALKARLEGLVRSQPVMLFMKGAPDAPKCGFSRKVVEALRAANTPFGSFDILSDEAVRQGLKEYSNWPTYPQLYVNGELLGGCDIVLELAEAGELQEAINDLKP